MYTILSTVVVLLLAYTVHHECATTYKCDQTSLCGCSPVFPILAKILGGEPSVAQSWPWIVSLRRPSSGKDVHFCAAVILEASHIITAAHCVQERLSMLSNITVCAGSHRLSDTCPQNRSVRQVIIHHGYNNRTHENDIAVIHLNEPFDFTDRWISKICLPSTETESQYPLAGTNVITIGWGKTEKTDTFSDDLQQVTLKVMDDSASACSNLLYNRRVQICANGPNKDACKGDSGGPLMQFTVRNRWELVGITSYGIANCTLPGKPGAYTRVSFYHNFINSVIQSTYKPPVNSLYTCQCQCPYGTDSGFAFTPTYSVESCIHACIKVSSNPCLPRNVYACLNSSCTYSSSYEHLTTTSVNELDLNLTFQTVYTYSNGDRYEGQTKDHKRHGRGTCYFASGNNYTGDWVEDNMAGQGVMTWSSGDKYIGSWFNNNRNGKGILIGSDGESYTGDWVDDVITGQGVNIWPSGDKYEGQFKDGWRHGVGTYYFPDGKNYTGNWVEGNRTGQGILTWSNGNKYIGSWFNGNRNGKGILIQSDGESYTGDWVDDMRMGQGVNTWTSGDKYEGQFKDDWQHGVGTYYFPSGSNYTGDWIEGDRTGQGVLIRSNGNKYIGSWFNHKRNGKGILILSNGESYTGDWVNDMRTGQGVYAWPSGDKYEGQFKNGKQHGVGAHYFSNGKNYTGDWVDGKMSGQGIMTWYKGDKYVGDWIDYQRNGKGIIVWPNGNHYMGDWIKDMREGKGIMTWSDGDTYIGDWLDDMRTGYGIYASFNGSKCEGRFDEGKISNDSKCNIQMKP